MKRSETVGAYTVTFSSNDNTDPSWSTYQFLHVLKRLGLDPWCLPDRPRAIKIGQLVELALTFLPKDD